MEPAKTAATEVLLLTLVEVEEAEGGILARESPTSSEEEEGDPSRSEEEGASSEIRRLPEDVEPSV